MRRDFVRQMPVPTIQNDSPKPPELPLSHKTLVQWEANVDKNKFEPSYLYNFDEEKQCAVIELYIPEIKSVIEFTYGRAFPYRFIVDGEEKFVSDSLRDIARWLDMYQGFNK